MASKARGLASLLGIINTDTDTFDGRDVSADGAKLDGIEAGATADQTPSEIKTAYESNANTNAFTDAEQSKLSGIEAGATADQTAAEIKTAYESNANTNAFTDAEKTKLSGIEAGANVTDTANVTAAGALMDSELADITAVKTLNQSLTTTSSPTFKDLNINDTTGYGNIEIGGPSGAYIDLKSPFSDDFDGRIITTGANLEITTSATGGGVVRLQHQGATKLSTTSTGVSVNGTVAATSFTGDGSNLTGIQSSPYDTATSSTGFFAFPSGTTAQRPSSPSAGYARFNSSKSSFEYYTGTEWIVGDLKPVISNISGSVFKGSASNITLTVAETTATFSVRYYNGSTIVETVIEQTQSNGSCVTAVPSSVYNLNGGTTITVRLVNENGVESSTSQSFTIGELPSGGTITEYGGYRIHQFTSSGTFTTGTFSGNVEYLVVAGGGGGGNRGSRWGGAGGGGGLRSSISGVNSGGGASTEASLSVSTNQSYTITVGGGGGPGSINGGTGGRGGTSSIGTAVTTVGGGGGGNAGGGSGGSGGGGSNSAGGGAGTAGQGYAGGGSTDQGLGGGGGGAAGAGAQNYRGPALSFTDKLQSGTVSFSLGGAMNTGAGGANTGNGGDAGYSGGADSGGSGIVYIRYQL